MSTKSSQPANQTDGDAHITNFIRNRIEQELAQGKYASRTWSGSPGPASSHANKPLDPARIRTRFPPEPNGYLHIGHAKSICLNFGLAGDYAGRCHLRFDDTNPLKEEQEFADSIAESIRWLGFDWHEHLYHASDYFEILYDCAVALIRNNLAYVDSQSPEQMRATRGTLTEAGSDSPYRNRSIAENLELFSKMRSGEFPDGAHVVRAKIDMASPNINMRDPTIYRIRRAHHHRTGDQWCIYPMYDFAHPISDALENITHSICTLEFADHRPFYDWLLEHLVKLGMLQSPVPEQIEFARLNLTSVLTSKRKLQQLVNEGHVAGWDDPRMPTLFGLRRRGYTPSAIRLFCDRIGVSKADGWIDYSVLEQALRDDLEVSADRAMAVLDPLTLEIENMPADFVENCSAPVHPQQPERGVRSFTLARELWIDRSDFAEDPPKGYFRLFPGNMVRLKYGFVIRCTGCEKDAAGVVQKVKAEYMPDSRSGTPGANNYKVKGVITWVAKRDAVAAPVNLYKPLFNCEQPGTGDVDFLTQLTPNSHQRVTAYLEPSVAHSKATHFQFERQGYFARDQIAEPGKPIQPTGALNFAVGLKDGFK